MDNQPPNHLPPPGYLYPPHLMPPHLGLSLAPPQLNPSAPHLLTVGSTVPAKRGSDEVQFVSSNPVKKRKLDDVASPTPQLPAVTASPPVASSHAFPLVQAPPPTAVNIPTTTPCLQTEVKMSTTVPQETSTEEGVPPEPLRGVSEPAFSTADFSDMWTAPVRGPRSSPAMSPKQLPLHVLPSQLQLSRGSRGNAQHTPTPEQSQPQAVSQPDPTPSALQAGKQPPLAEEENREIQAPTPQPGAPNFLGQLDFRGLDMLSGDDKQPPNPSHGDAPLDCPVKVDPGQHQQREHNATGFNDASLAAQAPISTSDATRDNITAPTSGQMQDAGQQQTLQSSPSQSSLPTQLPAGQVQCQGGTQHSAKSNCYHCFSARLRRNGVLQGPAVVTTTTTKPQMMPYQTLYQQQWPQHFTMGGFPSPYQNALTYGQLLRQQASATQESKNQPSVAPPAPVAPMASMTANMPSLSSSTNMLQSSMWNAQQSGLQAPQPASRQPQGHSTGKHIIVDMVETCLESFPFDDFAQRHNQSPKRIREIFEAIIQVPLLRCPTDKRRAGKVATAKMKEYTQAKKDLQGQMSGGQTQNQGVVPQPSAWEMAQFMGPSDVQIPGHLAFPGLW